MRTQMLSVRRLQTHVQEWGEPNLPKLFMLHGWMDCGASYKYLMPYLEQHFHVIAPDLRGFGKSEHDPNGYWFPDYFADLEVLLTHFAPLGKVDLLGHSMGGNIALMYAGIRPERIGRVLSLEGLGLPASEPGDAASKYRRWMQQSLSDEPTKVYTNADMLKHSIRKGNPSLPDHIVEDLVLLWGKPVGDDGAIVLRHDHKHRYANPVRYNFDDVYEIWKSTQAKVGLVMASNSLQYPRFDVGSRIKQACESLRIAPENYYMVENSNHMLHLEQPETTAQFILDFFV